MEVNCEPINITSEKTVTIEQAFEITVSLLKDTQAKLKEAEKVIKNTIGNNAGHCHDCSLTPSNDVCNCYVGVNEKYLEKQNQLDNK